MPDTRFNDGKTDRQGRFWSGSMFEAEGKPPAKIAALYRLDADLSVHRMVEGIGCSNGLAWSPDSRTMYYTDSHTSLVWALGLRPGERRHRQPPRLPRPERRGLHRRRRDRRRGRLLLADRAVQGQGPRLRSEGQADARRSTCRPTCRPAANSAARTSTRSTSPRRRSAVRPRPCKDQPQAGGLFAITGLGVRGLPLVPFRG